MNGDVRREWFDKDYYQVLGVPKNASAADIRKAYRKLAQRHHPDANQGNKEAEERFKEISAAYDVVGDEAKRKSYDQVRDVASSGFRGPGGTGGGRVRVDGFPFEGFEDVGDIGDLFGGLFGGSGRQRAEVRRGADLETAVRISFDDAMAGTTVPVRIRGSVPCETCGGSGAAPGTSPIACPQCGGTGAVAVNQGPFSISTTCPRCGGAGRLIEQPCPMCGGSGHTRSTRRIQVKIPAGVKDGARIRLRGRGEAGGPGAPPGDLYVVVHVAPHRFFGRRDGDLTLEVPVTYAEAALGAHVKVPTLNGDVTLKVPAGTRSGRTFRLRGKGAPKKGGHGDLLVTVKVDVPQRVSREERELLAKLREVERRKGSPRASLGVKEDG